MKKILQIIKIIDMLNANLCIFMVTLAHSLMQVRQNMCWHSSGRPRSWLRSRSRQTGQQSPSSPELSEPQGTTGSSRLPSSYKVQSRNYGGGNYSSD